MTEDENEAVVTALRTPKPRRRSFMTTMEFKRLRKMVIRITQEALAAVMINPDTGVRISTNCICKWECGLRPIPLWAARRMRELENAARKYDLRQV